MSWECPDDWKINPVYETCSEEMLVSLLFGGAKHFRQVKAPWFRRCNASGKLIWPFQRSWTGVVATKMPVDLEYGMNNEKMGKFACAWLTEDQYLMQKLKGNI